jgi:Asp/Glu/hydantoin racemase
MNIWYQSFVDPKQQAPYFRQLQRQLAAFSSPGVTFHLQGLTPPDRHLNRLTEFRCAVQVVRNAIRAEAQGYDAVAIGHFQDGGLYEARAAVDIPVLSLGEASMLFACTLGQKIGIVTIHPIFIPMIEEQVRRYGLRDRVVGVTAITSRPEDLVRAHDDTAAFDAFIAQFCEQVQPLLGLGAEVIIPGGGLPAMLLARLKGFTVGHAHILNPVGVLAKMTDMSVQLSRLHGTQISRASTFTKASKQAIKEFVEGGTGKTRGTGKKGRKR